jgi:RNA polymerase subunit RPABC4/transcription elongation factor Spt4
MFLIAGISPKTKILENTPRLCPKCGLAQAYLQRVDHYLSLFFIPLFPVKTGEPFVWCNRCEGRVDEIVDPIREEYPMPRGKQMIACGGCGRALETDYRYCPYCGAPVSRKHPDRRP